VSAAEREGLLQRAHVPDDGGGRAEQRQRERRAAGLAQPERRFGYVLAVKRRDPYVPRRSSIPPTSPSRSVSYVLAVQRRDPYVPRPFLDPAYLAQPEAHREGRRGAPERLGQQLGGYS